MAERLERMGTDLRPFSRIVVGTDGSSQAASAIDQATRLASTSGAVLDVIFVIDTGRPHDRPVEPIAEAALEAANAAATGMNVKAEYRIVAGDPATRLMEEAQDKRGDLLCVGPDAGLTAGPPRIGRVASRLVREASCPVLVARTTSRGFPNRIVCGIDGSLDSDALAALAASIAASSGAKLRLVHVAPILKRGGAARTLRQSLSAPETQETFRSAAGAGASIDHQVLTGRPERKLVAYSNRRGADLLIVGQRTHGSVQRALLGSVSASCVRRARCSVLVSRSDSK